MNTHENVIRDCRHDWKPVEGQMAQYRCASCGVLGRNVRALTLDRVDGPVGRRGVTPHRCRFTKDGLRCVARAVVRVDGKLRCAAHECGEHTRAARKALEGR